MYCRSCADSEVDQVAKHLPPGKPNTKVEGQRPQPDKFRTPAELRHGNLACDSGIGGRSADGRRTDNGRLADGPRGFRQTARSAEPLKPHHIGHTFSTKAIVFASRKNRSGDFLLVFAGATIGWRRAPSPGMYTRRHVLGFSTPKDPADARRTVNRRNAAGSVHAPIKFGRESVSRRFAIISVANAEWLHRPRQQR
jgi:hypothetical protein